MNRVLPYLVINICTSRRILISYNFIFLVVVVVKVLGGIGIWVGWITKESKKMR